MVRELIFEEWEEEVHQFTGRGRVNEKRDTVGHRDKEANRIFQSNRPFIAWDGEGITYPGTKQQSYVLFACSTGDYIRAAEGCNLGTERCLDLLFRVEQQHPTAYHVGFGFGYDVNQILSSFSRSQIYGLSQAVKRGRSYRWNGYRFRIHPGKLFRVSKGVGDEFQCVTIYDTFGFFQRRFIEVVRSYFPDELVRIESGKGNRSRFEYADLPAITKYCLAENDLLVRIMERLRDNFEERGLHLRDWHGPGAVASASLRSHKIKDHLGEIPKEIANASRLAYQGGRFELLRAGYHDGPVWQYDINSAYPSAIVNLPSLREGNWVFRNEFEPGTFGVWHTSYRDRRTDRFDRYSQYRAQPFFYRDSNGRIAYPARVDGWYWTPEVEAALENIDYPCDIDVNGGWVFYPASDVKPFKYVEEVYYERLEAKKRGDGIERALKLEINSLYGKFAQRSGWFMAGDRIPTYHCLEWAGYITSATRAKLFKVYCANFESIFSFETDAIFSTRPVHVPCGDRIGEWSVTKFSDILYIQSGFYFAHNSDGKTTEHYRGFDKGSISFENVYDWLGRLEPARTFDDRQPKLYGTTKRFVGFKRALQSRSQNYWRTWDTNPREISIGKDGKRIHLPGCPLCINRQKWTEGLHGLTSSLSGGISQPHKIPWSEEHFVENQWGEEKIIDLTDGFDNNSV